MSGTNIHVSASTDEGQMNGERKKGGWKTFSYITVGVLGLSTGGSGWGANFYIFLTKYFSMKEYDATQFTSIVNGFANFFPFVAAIFADSFFGSSTVASISSIFSVAGIILLQLTVSLPSLHPPKCNIGLQTCQPAKSFQIAFLCVSILLLCIGSGGTRYILSCLGADQFDELKDRDVFFNWYFFNLYLATFLGFSVIVYIEDNAGWDFGIGVCLVVIVIGTSAVLMGKRHYRHIKPQGSPFKSLARVIVASIRKRKVFLSPESQNNYYSENGSAPSWRLRFLNQAALKTQGDANPDGFIAKSWSLCTVEEVEDFKRLTAMLPLWTTSFLMSSAVGVQNTVLVPQAYAMDRHLGPNFEVPGATFLCVSLLSCTICISVMDRFLFPSYAKITGQPLTPLQRIGVGHILTILGLCASAIVESKRLHAASFPMSAMWLVIPLGIVGIGEAFHFPGQMLFYYQELPESLHSTSTGMISFVVAIGFYGGSVIIDIVHRVTPWVQDILTEGRLDKLFWLVAIIGAINFGYYLLCASMYKYHNVVKPEENSMSVTFLE